MYKHLFGPVPSRRLGMSLGVDLVPHKVCSMNCVYCECGRTTDLTVRRMEYVSISEVLEELDDFFSANPVPEVVTFSGAGEPLLNSGLGKVLKHLKDIQPRLPVAVLTNGSLLSDPDVRSAVLPADMVLPSLDAATEKTFRRIDRPFHGIDLEEYIQGLADFRKEYAGEIRLEVMILPGFNDNEEDLTRLREAILRMQPDRIQLNTLDRPGTVANLKAADQESLSGILSFWNLDNVEIIAPAETRRDTTAYRRDAESAILETISRRPCTPEDLSRILGMHPAEVNKYLGVLEGEKRILAVRQDRGVFYKPTT